jgi:hypothetical protein
MNISPHNLSSAVVISFFLSAEKILLKTQTEAVEIFLRATFENCGEYMTPRPLNIIWHVEIKG